MICLICRQTRVYDGFTSVEFKRAEMHLVINNVPARVCPACSESYIDEDVAVQLLQSAEEVYGVGVLEHVIDYGRRSL